MQWEKIRIDLGTVKENGAIKFTYTFEGDASKITSLSPGCTGCTTAKLIGNKIHVTYKPGSIPTHLARQGITIQPVTKIITVKYETGLPDVLYFTANLTKK